MNFMIIKRRTLIMLFLIILLASSLRGIFFVKYLHNFDLQGDAKNYRLMSQQLVDKGIFGYWYEGNKYGGTSGVSNARVTPGYPVFLSAVYAVFHDSYRQITATRALQVIIGGFFSPLLAFLFVRRLFKRDSVALLTAFFVAVYPTYIQSTISILTEVLGFAFMLLYFYLMTLGLQEKKFYFNLLAGGVFAIEILIRPTMLPLIIVPFIFAWVSWARHERTILFKIFLQTSIGFVVIMLPWWIRNYIVLHQIILTADASGNPLLSGTYPYMKDVGKDVPENIKGISSLQARFAKDRIIEGFSTQPFLYLKWYTIGKMQFMFQKPWLYNMAVGMQFFNSVIHNFFIWIGLIGVIINSVESKVNRYINIYGLLFLGLYLIFIPEARYTYQIMFFLMIAAAYLLCTVFNLIQKKCGINMPFNEKEKL